MHHNHEHDTRGHLKILYARAIYRTVDFISNRGSHFKTILRYHFLLTELSDINKSDNAHCSWKQNSKNSCTMLMGVYVDTVRLYNSALCGKSRKCAHFITQEFWLYSGEILTLGDVYKNVHRSIVPNSQKIGDSVHWQ